MEKGVAIEKFVKYMLITNKSLSTIESYERDVRLFLMHIHVDSVSSINVQILVDYFNYLVETGTKDSVMKRKHASLKSFFKFLTEQEILEVNPMAKSIRFPKNLAPVQVELTGDQLFTILDNIFASSLSTRDKLLVCLAFTSRLSLLELTQLTIGQLEHINLEDGLPAQVSSKISELLVEFATGQLPGNHGELLFLNGRHQPLTYKYVRQLVVPFLINWKDKVDNLENFRLIMTKK